MAVSKRLRYEVLRRDNHACRYCGASAPDATLTVDHVLPIALGGTDTADNLVAACVDCNIGKSSSSPEAQVVADVAAEALRWKAVTEEANRQLREKRDAQQQFAREAQALWDEWCGRWNQPRNAWGTFEQWYLHGVTVEDVKYAAIATFEGYGVMYHWAYFCGIIAKMLRQRDELAQQMLDERRDDG
jgi:hypothetical protein